MQEAIAQDIHSPCTWFSSNSNPKDSKVIMYNPKSKLNLKPCKKGETHNPKGRPKGKLTDLKAEYGLTNKDLENVLVYLMTKSVEELEEMRRDKQQPMLVASLCSALISSYKTGNLNAVNVFVERLFGKATQKTEASVSLSTPPNVSIMFAENSDEQHST